MVSNISSHQWIYHWCWQCCHQLHCCFYRLFFFSGINLLSSSKGVVLANLAEACSFQRKMLSFRNLSIYLSLKIPPCRTWNPNSIATRSSLSDPRFFLMVWTMILKPYISTRVKFWLLLSNWPCFSHWFIQVHTCVQCFLANPCAYVMEKDMIWQ